MSNSFFSGKIYCLYLNLFNGNVFPHRFNQHFELEFIFRGHEFHFAYLLQRIEPVTRLGIIHFFIGDHQKPEIRKTISKGIFSGYFSFNQRTYSNNNSVGIFLMCFNEFRDFIRVVLAIRIYGNGKGISFAVCFFETKPKGFSFSPVLWIRNYF